MTQNEQQTRIARQRFEREAREFLTLVSDAADVEVARERLYRRISTHQFDTYAEESELSEGRIVRVRDCSVALRGFIKSRSDQLAGFSVIQALFDIARGLPRPDLRPAFFADLEHLFQGLRGEGPGAAPGDILLESDLEGRAAALARSRQLDHLWEQVEGRMARYEHGLQPEVIARRQARQRRVLEQLGGDGEDWCDWRWQIHNAIREPHRLGEFLRLSDEEEEALARAQQARLPFGITPHYLALMDEEGGERDRAVRAQVIPGSAYIEALAQHKGSFECAFDFMLERDTSPIDLVTRRYLAIAILKPYNTCPQICTYCQRNWEIDEALAPDALAPAHKIDAAIEWIRAHPAIHEVLVTGGDPFALDDERLFAILHQVAAIPSLERIRIGTRTPVTLPMRIGDEVVRALSALREPLRREVALVTHIEHPYEITPELFELTEKLRAARINVYNQNVFTFFVSRRFEAACLRRLLKRVGIEPYYTFNTKGKEETAEFRVPIARLLQEQKEEARLLPGLTRTDEAVYNVPALGKNYLRARQHREVISLLPDGSRVYLFHPWERNIREQKSYLGVDVPILDYLQRLETIGESTADYETIWYYF